MRSARFGRDAGAGRRDAGGTARAVVACCALAAACAPALREPPPVSTMVPGPAGAVDAAELRRAADAAWERRREPGQAAAAQELYLRAAAADEQDVAALLGAMRAMTFRLERERGAADRPALATRQVELGQWCQRRAPSDPACDYRLALALGQQARERPSTGRAAIDEMVKLLRRAAAADPRLDSGGPHRVLALVLLRAPAWPIGPGDPEAALEEARAAIQLFPDVSSNQLALAEALEKNDRREEARAAYQQAVALAAAAVKAGDPDADRALAEARAAADRSDAR